MHPAVLIMVPGPGKGRPSGGFGWIAACAFLWIATCAFLLSLGSLQALSVSLQAQAPAPGAWPQFRGNPRLTGIAVTAPPATLKLLWKYEVGESIDSSAAIVNDVVYVGAGTGDLVAIDLATGKLRWK